MPVTPNAQIAMSELVRLGWSPVQAAGMVGRWQVEAYPELKTGALGDGSLASYGIGQWNQDRKQALKDFASQQGDDPNRPSLITQVRFGNHELRTNESTAGNALKAAQTPEDAAKAAMMYERPKGYSPDSPESGMHYDRTVANANTLAGAAPGLITGGAPGVANANSATGTVDANNLSATPSVTGASPFVTSPPTVASTTPVTPDVAAQAPTGLLGSLTSAGGLGALGDLAKALGGSSSSSKDDAAVASAPDISPSIVQSFQQTQQQRAQLAQQLMAQLMSKNQQQQPTGMVAPPVGLLG